jgi:hypothetical protein
VTPVALHGALADIAERWRVYYSHNYLAVALQSLLVGCVRVLRGHTGGLGQEKLLGEFGGSGIAARFRALFGRDLPKPFFELTARQTLEFAGATFSDSPGDVGACLDKLTIDAAFSERRLEQCLIDEDANDIGGIALATLLLYIVVLRYPQQVKPDYQNWYQQQVYDSYYDISVPGVAALLHGEFGKAWLDRSNEEILNRLIWRFVIRQHQAMSYARGFGGSSSLFHVDGTTVIGTSAGYTDPRALNPRLRSTLQILYDIGLIDYDDDGGCHRTSEGDTWLDAELKRETGA